MRLTWHLVALALLVSSPASAQREPDVARDLIHSDLPLFGYGTENMWPRSFFDEDSFGCVSRVAFGEWELRETYGDLGADSIWYSIINYGVMHCAAVVSVSYDRAALESATAKPSFFVLLGTVRFGEVVKELWALQIGARPGSDYLLLSRSPDDGMVVSFTVLQSACPRGHSRHAGSIGLRTDYCSINSQRDLLRMARRMARLPPLGTFSLAEDETPSE